MRNAGAIALSPTQSALRLLRIGVVVAGFFVKKIDF
jgi:hypothetical protein